MERLELLAAPPSFYYSALVKKREHNKKYFGGRVHTRSKSEQLCTAVSWSSFSISIIKYRIVWTNSSIELVVNFSNSQSRQEGPSGRSTYL